jgi:hypothetical protein
LEFFFDAEGEDVVFRAHTDTATSLKIAARKSPAILALNLLR